MTIHPAFLSSAFKKRRDEYDGSMENRCRFLLEILGAMMQVWGPNTVGLKLNPIATSGGFAPHADTADTFRSLVTKLNENPLADLHLRGDVHATNPAYSDALKRPWAAFRSIDKGLIMAGGGCTHQSGEATLQRGDADVIAYGALSIANPDLVARFRSKARLTQPHGDFFSRGGSRGYTGYFTL
jgi:N-ethylmaleimide reductase